MGSYGVMGCKPAFNLQSVVPAHQLTWDKIQVPTPLHPSHQLTWNTIHVPPPFIQPISLPGVQYRLSPPSSSPAAHLGYNIGNPPPLHPSQQLTWDTISNQIKYIYLSQAQKHRKYHILEHIYKLETGGIDSQGLFNTQPPTGESVFAMMLT